MEMFLTIRAIRFQSSSFFSGDDDVWVYIDNKLALDVGGAHGKASGLLEFGTNEKGNLIYTSYVSKVKKGNTEQSYQPCEDNEDKKDYLPWQ